MSRGNGAWDAVVVGLGGVGSFTLSALTKHSNRVLGIERFVRGHSFGSSHGASRIYRRAYFEHPKYVPYIQYSIQEFQRLQETSGVSLLQECGTLILEEPDGPVVKSCMESAQQHGIPVEHLSTSDLKERYPQFQYDKSNLIGLLEPDGGFVRPELAMRAALDEAEACGATILENSTVKSLKEVENESGDTEVEVAIEGEDNDVELVTAKSVIISAGAWASELAPTFSAQLKVTRQLQGWKDVSTLPDPTLYEPSRMPTWYLSTLKSPLPLYGIPADPQSENPNSIKLGLHLRETIVDPNASRPTLTEPEWKELQQAGDCALAENKGMTWSSAMPCLYTMSPDGHFLVGPPLGSRRLFVAAGLSGHGFKMTPALGQMLADWALDTQTRDWRADFLHPSRFGV